ncbi:hypothetical protein HDU98_002637 [Podochytrium sp. JEL0797]|nr:hypothetical protein HDU98_002637 [Podochytrium sp. JEL0797]
MHTGTLKRRSSISYASTKKRPAALFTSIRPQPYGIQPYGNMLFHTGAPAANRQLGLGALAVLDDASIVSEIMTNTDYFSDTDILRLSRCSKALYVFANFEEVWRSRTINRFKGDFGSFSDCWKNTYKKRLHNGDPGVECVLDVPIKVGFFSDFLFSSWRCSTIPLDVLCRSNAVENIDRRAGLSMQEFTEQYDKPGKPVILTDVVTKWPAFKKWSMEYLVETVGDVEFRAESCDLPFKTYAAYATHCGQNGGSFEEAPLYLFDKHFSKRTSLCDDFNVPEYFEQDLFSLLGPNERPDHRWLIIGPPRSGSTYHLDPNSTNAWNAVITGSKKWIFFPPGCPPPGVFPSEDGSEVTTPISLAEWFLNHYDEMKSWPVKPLECVQKAGEIIYVPRGWWHCVMNLEECIAITQNFVNDNNLKEALTFVREKPDQISGYGRGPGGCELANTFYDRFSAVLKKTHPGVVEEELARSQQVEKEGKTCCGGKDTAQQEASISNLFTSAEEPSSFSFSFSS